MPYAVIGFHFFAPITHRQAFFSVNIAKALDVVEDEPCKADDHKQDEGDGHEEDRRTVDEAVRVRHGDHERRVTREGVVAT